MTSPQALQSVVTTKVRESRLWSLLALMLLLLALFACPTVTIRRLVLLVALRKQWDPSWLENDWMFSRPHYNHLVFNEVFGFPTRLLPLEVVTWTGAILSWTLLLMALLRLGRFYRIPGWMITPSIALWLTFDQAIVAQEYILGTFESKTIAYVFLLFALNLVLEGRHRVGAVLLGLSFSFHPAVGMWGALGLGLALAVRRTPIPRMLEMAGLILVFSLPGLVPLLAGLIHHLPGASAEARFLSIVVFPNHMDPFSWPHRSILFVYLLMLFNGLQARSSRDASIRLLVAFQLALGLFFTLGLICRALEIYGFLVYMPFRLFPVFVQLLFFFHLSSAYQQAPAIRPDRATVLVGLVALMSFGDPLGRLTDAVKLNAAMWTHPEEDVQKAYRWIDANTPHGAIVIAPPWRKDSHYLTGRAQVATWEIYAHDRPVEWRERMEALVGNDWKRLEATSREHRIEAMDAAYSRLSEADIRAIVARYGGDYLVSRTLYAFPVLFDTATYKVYALHGKS
jgi:hypothetical protein